MERIVICHNCGGTGLADKRLGSNEQFSCPTCEGSGRMLYKESLTPYKQKVNINRERETKFCKECGGTGELFEGFGGSKVMPCWGCGGTGKHIEGYS